MHHMRIDCMHAEKDTLIPFMGQKNDSNRPLGCYVDDGKIFLNRSSEGSASCSRKYPCLGYKDPQSEPGESYDLVSHVPEGHEKALEENAHIDSSCMCSQISVDTNPVTGFTDPPTETRNEFEAAVREQQMGWAIRTSGKSFDFKNTQLGREMCQKAARDLGFQYDTNWPDGVGCKLTKTSIYNQSRFRVYPGSGDCSSDDLCIVPTSSPTSTLVRQMFMTDEYREQEYCYSSYWTGTTCNKSEVEPEPEYAQRLIDDDIPIFKKYAEDLVNQIWDTKYEPLKQDLQAALGRRENTSGRKLPVIAVRKKGVCKRTDGTEVDVIQEEDPESACLSSNNRWGGICFANEVWTENVAVNEEGKKGSPDNNNIVIRTKKRYANYPGDHCYKPSNLSKNQCENNWNKPDNRWRNEKCWEPANIYGERCLKENFKEVEGGLCCTATHCDTSKTSADQCGIRIQTSVQSKSDCLAKNQSRRWIEKAKVWQRDEQNAKLDPDRIEKQINNGTGKNIDEFSGCFNEYNWWQNQFVTKDACTPFQWEENWCIGDDTKKDRDSCELGNTKWEKLKDDMGEATGPFPVFGDDENKTCRHINGKPAYTTFDNAGVPMKKNSKFKWRYPYTVGTCGTSGFDDVGECEKGAEHVGAYFYGSVKLPHKPEGCFLNEIVDPKTNENLSVVYFNTHKDDYAAQVEAYEKAEKEYDACTTGCDSVRQTFFNHVSILDSYHGHSICKDMSSGTTTKDYDRQSCESRAQFEWVNGVCRSPSQEGSCRHGTQSGYNYCVLEGIDEKECEKDLKWVHESMVRCGQQLGQWVPTQGGLKSRYMEYTPEKCDGIGGSLVDGECYRRINGSHEKVVAQPMDKCLQRLKQTQSDCASSQIVVDGVCVAKECPTDKILTEGGECRSRTQEDCTEGLVLHNSVCKTCAEIDSSKPVLGDDNICRARVGSDCPDDSPVFDESSKSCRVRVEEDCTALGKVLDAESRLCRERRESDCAANQIWTGSECRRKLSSDCPDDKPILIAGSYKCRERTQQDCSPQKLDASTKQCRPYEARDCEGTDTPVFESSEKGCRKANFEYTMTTDAATEDAAVEEGESITFTVQRTGDTGHASSVKFQTQDGTAVEGEDYAERILDVAFGPDMLEQSVTVTTNEDNENEETTESFKANLGETSSIQAYIANKINDSCEGDTPVLDSATGQCRAIQTSSFVVVPAVAARPAGFKCITNTESIYNPRPGQWDWYCKRFNCKSSCAPHRWHWRAKYCKVSNQQVCDPVEASPAVTEMRVSENLVDMGDGNTMSLGSSWNKQVGGGRGHRWQSVHKATLPAPTVISKIKLTAQMQEQNYGRSSYGRVVAIGSYQGKRSWQKTVTHSKAGKSGRGVYTENFTNGFVDVGYCSSESRKTKEECECLNRQPGEKCNPAVWFASSEQTSCPSWGWSGGWSMPNGSDGGKQCGGVPTQGLTDKIEIWHQSRRGAGHVGYAKNVVFHIQ